MAGWLLSVSLLLASGGAAAGPAGDGPSVQGLLDLCDRGAANEGRGVEAAGCEWFAAPCPCKLRGQSEDGVTWCVPETVTIDEEVRAVLAELRRLPDKSVPAETAVGAILRRLYPCPIDPGR